MPGGDGYRGMIFKALKLQNYALADVASRTIAVLPRIGQTEPERGCSSGAWVIRGWRLELHGGRPPPSPGGTRQAA
jgi:hypothetical protein